jgi:hypothetical protein
VKTEILKVWAKERGLIADEASLETINTETFATDDAKHLRDQSQLFLLLYITKLVSSLSNHVAAYL